MKKAYKIVDKINGTLFFLYHGVKGSRKIPLDVWLKADKKLVIDGTGGKKYISAFHIFLSKEQAKKYLKRFRKPYKVIVEVAVVGLRPKGANGVYLANKIKINNSIGEKKKL